MVDEEMNVVAAAIVHDGRVLIAMRREGSFMAGRWELPGGKVEKGEKPEGALVREISEELGIQIKPERLFHRNEHVYLVDGKKRRVNLMTYLCRPRGDEPKALGCAEFRWIKPKELKKYDFVDADQDVVEKIARHYHL